MGEMVEKTAAESRPQSIWTLHSLGIHWHFGQGNFLLIIMQKFFFMKRERAFKIPPSHHQQEITPR